MRRRSGWVVILIAQLAFVAPAIAGGVAIVGTTLNDNGDDDGFADTDETVTLHVTVRNTSGVALDDVALTLVTESPSVACVSVPTIQVGNLAPNETKEVSDAFVFTVAAVDRTTLGLGPNDPLVLNFGVHVDSTPAGQRAFPGTLAFDLDLDVSGGPGSETFFEGFESSTDPMGQFEVQNIDEGKASLPASDGYRCQYNDPDDPNSNTYGSGSEQYCFMGANPSHAAAEWWSVSGPEFSPAGGRGFSGFHSLFFGLDLGPPENWTTPTGVLEAARMTDPVYLAAEGTSTLTIKHQASFADGRAFSLGPRDSYDRGVVMVQVADAAGNPVGPWFRIAAYQNGYDQQNAPYIVNCTYDPIDDGSTEDDYYSPSQPDRRYGPSSTCYPQWVFVRIGETSNPYDANALGYAEGPGLQGLWGIGTWIESKFDLSRFRGRGIRVRFVAATVNTYTYESWEDVFALNPNPGDDGWWIDDVQIDNLVATPATLSVDDKDNSSLPDVTGDLDGDGVPDVCDNCAMSVNAAQEDEDHDGVGDDCDPCRLNPDNFDPDVDGICGLEDNCPYTANPTQADGDGDGVGTVCDCDDASDTTYPGAPEINDGIDNNCAGDVGYGQVDEISGDAGFHDPDGDTTLYSWPAQSGAGAYQIARSGTPTFSGGCVFDPTTTTDLTVAYEPAPGEVAYLLVRALVPLRGSWGADSSGTTRPLVCAP